MANWYSTDWWHRVPVIVKASQAGGATHADYPCLLASSLPAHLWGRVRSDGLDCVLTAADGVTPLYREVATFDVAGERPEVYFRLPSYSHLEDTLVYLYYRNPDYSEPSDVAVWPTDTWAAVYHMNDAPGDPTRILDSTANANHGTKGAGAAAPTEVAGSVAMAQEFDGSDDYISLGAAVGAIAGDVTWMALFNIDAAAPAEKASLIGGGSTSLANVPYALYQYRPAYTPHACTSNTIGSVFEAGTGTALSLGVWHISAGQVDGATLRAFLDGAQSGADVAITGTRRTAGNIYVGTDFTTYSNVDGLICELRISSVARSAEWIAAEDHWLRNNSLCYEVGAYEHRPLYIMQGYRRTTDGASATPQTYRRVSERTEYVAQGYRRLTLPAEYIAQGYRRVVNKALYTIATKRRLRPLYRILGRPSYGMDHHPKPDYGLGPNGRPDDRNL